MIGGMYIPLVGPGPRLRALLVSSVAVARHLVILWGFPLGVVGFGFEVVC